MLAGWLAGSQDHFRRGIRETQKARERERERRGREKRGRERQGLGFLLVYGGVACEQTHISTHTQTEKEPSKEPLFSCRSFVSQ